MLLFLKRRYNIIEYHHWRCIISDTFFLPCIKKFHKFVFQVFVVKQSYCMLRHWRIGVEVNVNAGGIFGKMLHGIPAARPFRPVYPVARDANAGRVFMQLCTGLPEFSTWACAGQVVDMARGFAHCAQSSAQGACGKTCALCAWGVDTRMLLSWA